MIIPLINQLWLIIVLLAVMRAMGMAGSALNFALVTDLVRNRSDIGKVTSTTVVGGNTFGLCGADRHGLRGADHRQFRQRVLYRRVPAADRRGRDVDDDAEGDLTGPGRGGGNGVSGPRRGGSRPGVRENRATISALSLTESNSMA